MRNTQPARPRVPRPLRRAVSTAMASVLALGSAVTMLVVVAPPAASAAPGDPLVGFVTVDDNSTTPGARLWVSKGDGTFTQCSVWSGPMDRSNQGTGFAGDGGAENSFVADVTGDGLVDLVHVTEDNNNQIRVYPNQGDGTFATTGVLSQGFADVPSGVFAGYAGNESGRLGDVNGDGFPDYVFGVGNTLHAYLNHGSAGANGWFDSGDTATNVVNANGLQATGFAGDEQSFLQDVNGDGNADWVIAHDNALRTIETYLSNGDGTFATAAVSTAAIEDMPSYHSNGVSAGEQGFLADVNGDGDLDYVFAADSRDVWAWFGNGDGTFAVLASAKTSGFASFTGTTGHLAGRQGDERTDLVDVTGDGVLDLVVTIDGQGANSGFYAYTGNGDGTFATTPTTTVQGGALTRMETGDDGTQSSGFGAVVPDGFDLSDCDLPHTGWMYVHGHEGAGLAGAVDAYAVAPDGTLNRNTVASTQHMTQAGGTMAGFGGTTESTFLTDVTGDGLLDWVHLDDNIGSGFAWVWPGTGNATFSTTAVITQTPTTPTGGAVPINFGGDSNNEVTFLIDVTQDGIPDVVTANESTNGGTIDVYPGNGDGTWANTGPKVRSTTGLKAPAGVSSMAGTGTIYEATFLKDVTGDGLPDWVHVDDGTGSNIAVWPGLGDGTFSKVPADLKVKNPAGPSGTVLGADFSGDTTDEVTFLEDVTSDGIRDIVHCARSTSGGTIATFPGNGDGTWNLSGPSVRQTTGLISGGPASWGCSDHLNGATFLADVTGPAHTGPDGKLDLVYSDDGTSNEFTVWYGNGDGTWNTTSESYTTVDPSGGALDQAGDDFSGQGTSERTMMVRAAGLFEPDTDTDGVPDSIDIDDDNDGVRDTDELAAPCGTDCDGDGIPNIRDTDDDGDGIPTLVEHVDADADGQPDVLGGPDLNGNGMADNFEAWVTPVDFDHDTTQDWLDVDDDGDGLLTIDEGPADADADGHPNYLDPLDVTAPAAPVITGPADGTTTNDPTPTISGTGEPGATVDVVDEHGDPVCSAIVTPAGIWTCTPASSMPEGDHTLTATQTDPAGNESPASAPVDLTIDTTDPAPPVVTGPTDGSTTGDPTPPFTGTGEPGSTVDVVDQGGNPVCTATVQPDGTWSCTPATPLPDGPGTYTTTQTDPAGNTSPPSPPITVVVDTTAPPAPVLTGPADGSTTNDSTPTVTGTGEPGSTVDVVDQGGNPVCSATVQPDGTWSCTPASPLPDGQTTLTATQTDPSGNESPTSAPVTVTIDASAPTVPVVTSPLPGAVSNDPTPTITGTGEPGASVDVIDEHGDPVCSATVQADGTWSCTPSSPFTDGPHTITATQTDPSGNPSGQSAPVPFTTDTAAPAAPVITGPADGSHIHDATPTITGTGEPGDTVVVTDEGGATACTAVVLADGTWSCTVTTPLADGPHTFTPTQTDPAGNVSPAGAPVTVTLDTTAPAAPVLTGPADGTSVSDNTPPFTGTGEPGSTVVVTDEGGATVCTAVVQPDGSWTCTPSTPLPDGEHTYTPTQTDPAGNESPSGQPVTVTVDTTAPVAPVITGPQDGSTITDTTPLITGTGEPGATIEVTEGGHPVCTAVVTASGAWSCTPTTPLAVGSHTFTATQTDAVGNESPAADPVTVTVKASSNGHNHGNGHGHGHGNGHGNGNGNGNGATGNGATGNGTHGTGGGGTGTGTGSTSRVGSIVRTGANVVGTAAVALSLVVGGLLLLVLRRRTDPGRAAR